MKTATLSLLATTVVFAGTSIYLALELGKARDALSAEVAARNTQVPREPQREVHESLDLDVDEHGADMPEVPAAAGKPPAPSEAPSANRSFAGRNDERPAGGFNSAAAQRQRRLSQETRLRQQFSDMPGELGLDRAQADKLFDLLADAQIASANNRRAYADDPLGARALADAARQERDAQINALLGPDKAAEFLSFEKSIGARMQVGRIDADMTAADIPLRDDQRQAMIVAIAAEQAARPAPQRVPGGNDQDYQSEFLAWQADYSKRVQATVEPLLSAEQRARYREATELQNARRAQQRARAEQRRNANQQQQP
ncbi:MAG: hypothetical protein WDO72_08485 [Pseudomonadota bacterium]